MSRVDWEGCLSGPSSKWGNGGPVSSVPSYVRGPTGTTDMGEGSGGVGTG